MKTVIAYFILIITLISCERQTIVEVDIPQKSKIFAAVFIGEGDEIVTAYISRSKPLIGAVDTASSSQEIIDNAEVFFQTPDSNFTLSYMPNELNYQTFLNGATIKTNVAYKLKVMHKGEVSEGSTILPDLANVAITSTIDSIFDKEFEAMKYSMQASFKNKGNHAYLCPQVLMVYEDSSKFPMSSNDIQTVFSVKPGEEFRLEFNQNVQMFGVKPVRIETTVYSISRDLYLYQSKVNKVDFFSFLPFSEPSFLHSNMSSGIGIFGSYRITATGSRNLN